MKTAILQPTPFDTYRIVYEKGNEGVPCDFGRELECSREQEEAGDIEGACNTRFAAFQQLASLVPEDEVVELEWEDNNDQGAILLLSCSAIDHFLVGDFEMCAAMLEMQLEFDPEDHLEATKRLAYCYVALEEWELFDEVVNDISDKYADKELVALWAEFRRHGAIPEGELRHFRSAFRAYYDEFVADEHPADEAYLAEIESERPSKKALARELWLQTEHLWKLFPGFIEELKASGSKA